MELGSGVDLGSGAVDLGSGAVDLGSGALDLGSGASPSLPSLINVGSAAQAYDVSWALTCAGLSITGGASYSVTHAVSPGSCTLKMWDFWGDGWNGNTFKFTNTVTKAVAAKGTLTKHGKGNFPQDVCLPDGCYEITVGGGSYKTEVRWAFGQRMGHATTGGTHFILKGGKAQKSPIPRGCPPPAP